MKKLHITIAKNGETNFEVEGAIGKECEVFTKDFEDALGEVKNREYTDDYYREDIDLDEQVREQF